MQAQLQGKLSDATLKALMAHLNPEPASTTANSSRASDSSLSSEGSTNGDNSGQPGDKTHQTSGIADKVRATEGLDIASHQHTHNTHGGVSENFGMSQFWYTEATAKKLAAEALSLGGRANEVAGVKRIAFVSCPSAFKAALEMDYDKDEYELYLFEYDTRFGDVYGDQFVFFDFHSPYMHEDYVGQFDYVLADPPYLVDTCMKSTVKHMIKLGRDGKDTPMAMATGSVMSEAIYEFAQFRESKFHPEHESKLGNEFSVFSTYDPEQLGGWYPLEEVVKDFDESYFSKSGRKVVAKE